MILEGGASPQYSRDCQWNVLPPFLSIKSIEKFTQRVKSQALLSLDPQNILEFEPTSQICISVTVNPKSLHAVCTTVRKNRIGFTEMGSHNFSDLGLTLRWIRMFSQFTRQRVTTLCKFYFLLLSLGLTGIQKWVVPCELFLDRRTKACNSSPRWALFRAA